MSSWLAGIVKEVQSGDTLVIASTSRLPNGLLAEKRLNLASLSAPRMVRALPANQSKLDRRSGTQLDCTTRYPFLPDLDNRWPR
jgi:hypothetical protein